jgi:hypothetical protein
MSNEKAERLLEYMEAAIKSGRVAWERGDTKGACPYDSVDDGTPYLGGLLRACWLRSWEGAADNVAQEHRRLAAEQAGPVAHARHLAGVGLRDLWEVVHQLPYGWSTAQLRWLIAKYRLRLAYRTLLQVRG